MVDVVDDDGDAQIFFPVYSARAHNHYLSGFFCLLIPIFGLCGIVDSRQRFVLRQMVRIPEIPF